MLAAAVALSLSANCGVDGDGIVFEEPRAAAVSRDEVGAVLVDLAAKGHSLALVGNLTVINQEENPWLVPEVEAAVETALRDGEALGGLVSALVWCGGPASEVLLRDLTERCLETECEQLAELVEGLRYVATEDSLPLLRRVVSEGRGEPGGLAERVVSDLTAGEATSWVFQRVWVGRQWAVTTAEKEQAIQARKDLIGCRGGLRREATRLLLESCRLPVEAFPSRAELARAGGAIGMEERWLRDPLRELGYLLENGDEIVDLMRQGASSLDSVSVRASLEAARLWIGEMSESARQEFWHASRQVMAPSGSFSGPTRRQVALFVLSQRFDFPGDDAPPLELGEIARLDPEQASDRLVIDQCLTWLLSLLPAGAVDSLDPAVVLSFVAANWQELRFDPESGRYAFAR